MATNVMPFSHPASPDDLHGTGWNQDLTGRGMHGKRCASASTAASASNRQQQPG